MARELKSRPAKASVDDAGRFSALVSVFGNVDLEGDIVMPGAFARTLEERGLPPIYHMHDWAAGPIGATEKADEVDAGLVIEGRLFLDESELSRRIHASMRAGQLREFSFAYDTRVSRHEQRDNAEVRLLDDVELYEVGPCLVGMNPATELISVRSLWTTPSSSSSTNNGSTMRHDCEAVQDADNEGAAAVALPRGLLLARPR